MLAIADTDRFSLWLLKMKSENNEQVINCSLCKQIVPKLDIRKHTAGHFSSEGSANICNICDKHFLDKTKLKIHQRIHTGEKPFMCTFCDKTFATNGQVKKHEDNIHTKSNFRYCDKCGNSFASKRGLESHLEKMHGIRNRFQCTICPTYFMTEDGLKKHMSTNSCQNCNVCQKMFSTKTKLDKHKNVHLNPAFKTHDVDNI